MTQSVFYVLDGRAKGWIALEELVVLNKKIDRDEKLIPMLWAVYKSGISNILSFHIQMNSRTQWQAENVRHKIGMNFTFNVKAMS